MFFYIQKVRRESGFTLLEIMVVVTIISFLIAVGIISFNQSLQESRDRTRMAQLDQLRIAVELYKAQYGRYPEKGCRPASDTRTWTGPGPYSTVSWALSCDEYIEGLVPEFISELPLDPLREYEEVKGYIYTTNSAGTYYKILNHHTVERLVVNAFSHPYARCPYSCGGGAAVYCANTTVLQRDIYAVYSAGAECL